MFLIIYLLYVLSVLSFPFASTSDLNVGTTLFTKADTFKECWSTENLALLTSRMILEDLLPSTEILQINSNEFVGDLVEYFRLILEIVRQKTSGRIKHITLVALTDLLGGYLYHAVLPVAKHAFYAGLIDFDSMQSLLGLFDELKWFLRTNGQGWNGPRPENCDNNNYDVQPLQLTSSSDAPENCEHACDNLLYFTKKHQQQPSSSSSSNSHQDDSSDCDMTIPLPFFDSVRKPSAIALPTKHCMLHNVEANSSAYIVMKFFTTSYKCMVMKSVSHRTMARFTGEFSSWIEHQIVPRLNDVKFYAAFGGILRVRDTLKRMDADKANYFDKQVGDMNRIMGDKHNGGDASKITGITDNSSKEESNDESRGNLVLTAILIVIFVWFLLGSGFVCWRIRAKKKNPDGNQTPSKYTETNSTLKSSKYFYPDPPKSDYKGTSSGETEKTSTTVSDRNSKRRARKGGGLISGLSTFCSPQQQQPSAPPQPSPQALTMTIKTIRGRDGCRCGETAVTTTTSPDNASTRAVIDTDMTEKRLPSIAEISERSMSTSRGNQKLENNSIRSGGTGGGGGSMKKPPAIGYGKRNSSNNRTSNAGQSVSVAAAEDDDDYGYDKDNRYSQDETTATTTSKDSFGEYPGQRNATLVGGVSYDAEEGEV